MIKKLVPALVTIWCASILPASAEPVGMGSVAFTGEPRVASQWNIKRLKTADRDDRTYDYSDSYLPYDDGYDDGYDNRYPDYSYGGGYYPRGYRGRHSRRGHDNGYHSSQGGIQTPAQQGGMRGR